MKLAAILFLVFTAFMAQADQQPTTGAAFTVICSDQLVRNLGPDLSAQIAAIPNVIDVSTLSVLNFTTNGGYVAACVTVKHLNK